MRSASAHWSLIAMWVDLHGPHPAAACHDAGRAARRRHRSLRQLESERRPAADALKSWGLAHRFAGSGDRAAIAGLVYDALRRRASSAFLMGADTPRAILLGMLKRERGLDSGRDRASSPTARTMRRAALTRRRAPAARCRRPWRARRRMSPAIIRNGSSRISPAPSATTRAEEGAALAVARAARPAREHAEGRPRQGGRRCCPT